MEDQRVGAAWIGGIESLRDYKNIPATTVYDLCRYVLRGKGGGNFITAVVENDLKAAFQHADLSNIKGLWAIATWLYNRAPKMSHGSTVIVQNWRSMGGLQNWYQGPDDIRQQLLTEWFREATNGTLLEGSEMPK